jgi:hypothetical protein
MNHERATGALASVPDYRDKYLAGMLAGAAGAAVLPAYFDTDLKNLGPVLDQNKTPSCVSHAWALMLKLYWYRKTGEVVDFSPRFLDILSNEPGFPVDGGRRPRNVCKVSVTYGCCTTKTLPNDTEGLSIAKYRDPASISKEAYAEALKYRIPGYISVPLDKASMRTAIQLFGAVSTLFVIGKEFYTSPAGVVSWDPKDINPLRTPQEMISGHQIVVKGWKDLYNRLRNSWSIFWNNDGEGDYNVDEWRNFIFEAWAPAQIPKDVALFLKTLPSASAFSYDFLGMPTLTQGMQNDHVRFLQIALMIKGYLDPVPAEQLGIYGPKTSAAVLKYQQKKGIAPPAGDSVGPKTKAALAKDFPL